MTAQAGAHGTAPHEQFRSSTTFILAAVGGAVGLGNLWRFPYVAGSNGGSVFVISYLIAVVCIALPLLMAEMVIGRRGGMSPTNTLRKLARETGSTRAWVSVGWLNFATLFLVLASYSVVAGWTLAYFIKTLGGSFAGVAPATVSAAFSELLSDPFEMIGWHIVTMVITVAIIGRGLHSGIERFTSVLMPMFFVVLVLLVGYSVWVGATREALAYLFQPDFSALTPGIVLAAIGQAFYSITVGVGFMLMYAAYLPKHVRLAPSAAIITGADTLIALLAGMAIFPIVFAYGLDPAEGTGLLFVTLSTAFAQMEGGQYIGSLFFLLAFIAALTSCIGALEPLVSRAEESRSISRPAAATLIGCLVGLFGLSTVFSFNVWADFRPLAGMTLQELGDWVTGSIMLPLGGMLYAIFAGWRLTREDAREALSMSDGFWFNCWYAATRYLAPVAIAGLLIANLA
jgi:NSS family neurotransmitter:Na+ symporter